MPKYLITILAMIFGGVVVYFANPPSNYFLNPASPAFSGTDIIPYRIVPAGKYINFEYVGAMPSGECDGPEDNISFIVCPDGIAVCRGGSTWKHVQFDE